MACVPAPTCTRGVSPDVRAVAQIRRMPGGSQSHLMLCSDGRFCVVKFQNNPQHRRVLFNEVLAARLMREVGLPTPEAVVVKVAEALIDRTNELTIDLPRYRVPCSPGLQFGSVYVGNPYDRCTSDSLRGHEFGSVANLRDFLGMLVFDKWCCNCDRRQVVFLRKESEYSVVGIDHSYCFGSGEWDFPDAPLRGLHHNVAVYREVRTIEDFEPWLSRLETLDFSRIDKARKGIPPEWYDYNEVAVSRLIHRLDRRKGTVRELIRSSCEKLPLIFPQWIQRRILALRQQIVA